VRGHRSDHDPGQYLPRETMKHGAHGGFLLLEVLFAAAVVTIAMGTLISCLGRCIAAAHAVQNYTIAQTLLANESYIFRVERLTDMNDDEGDFNDYPVIPGPENSRRPTPKTCISKPSRYSGRSADEPPVTRWSSTVTCRKSSNSHERRTFQSRGGACSRRFTFLEVMVAVTILGS